MDLPPLPSDWRPSWRYGEMVFTLVRPPPVFTEAGYRDTFWERMLTQPIDAVIHELQREFARLRAASSATNPAVLLFAHDALDAHAKVVRILLIECDRVDWYALCDIAPEPHLWRKSAVMDYLRGDAPQMWKL